METEVCNNSTYYGTFLVEILFVRLLAMIPGVWNYLVFRLGANPG
jgi:hypothetical protein